MNTPLTIEFHTVGGQLSSITARFHDEHGRFIRAVNYRDTRFLTAARLLMGMLSPAGVNTAAVQVAPPVIEGEAWDDDWDLFPFPGLPERPLSAGRRSCPECAALPVGFVCEDCFDFD